MAGKTILETERIKFNYRFSEPILYKVCRMVIDCCEADLAVFNKFAGRYNEGYIALFRGEVETAEKMKVDRGKLPTHVKLGIDLIPLAINCRSKWVWLKSYIKLMSGVDELKANCIEAGGEYYNKSANNWDDLSTLCEMGMTFINDHEEDLLKKGEMPAGFKNDFGGAVKLFEDSYAIYLKALKKSIEETDEKVSANNAIYKKAVAICKDCKAFMRDDERKKVYSMRSMGEKAKLLLQGSLEIAG